VEGRPSKGTVIPLVSPYLVQMLLPLVSCLCMAPHPPCDAPPLLKALKQPKDETRMPLDQSCPQRSHPAISSCPVCLQVWNPTFKKTSQTHILIAVVVYGLLFFLFLYK
jgi:hypothetical protein